MALRQGAAARRQPCRSSGSSLQVCDLDLCRVYLICDANYPCWVVLVPRIDDVTEITDLTAAEQGLLWEEVAKVTKAVQVGAPEPLPRLHGMQHRDMCATLPFGIHAAGPPARLQATFEADKMNIASIGNVVGMAWKGSIMRRQGRWAAGVGAACTLRTPRNSGATRCRSLNCTSM